MKDLLDEYPVVVEIPIAWGDMDALQHVNNTIYFKHFECVRVVYLEKIDFLGIMSTSGIGPILASTQCRYKIPLTYPDQVKVGAKVERIEKDRFFMKYATASCRHHKIAALGEGELVAYDYQRNVKAMIPDEIRTRIIQFEKSAGQILREA